jgi:hypothetical protein
MSRFDRLPLAYRRTIVFGKRFCPFARYLPQRRAIPNEGSPPGPDQLQIPDVLSYYVLTHNRTVTHGLSEGGNNMRARVLLSAGLFGGVMAALALAQTTSTNPAAPGSSETTAPASTNNEPPAGKPPESGGPESTQGASGGPGNTQATAPGPGSNAPSANPAPSGTPKEPATGTETGKKPVNHGAATSQTHGQVMHPPSSGAKHASTIGQPHRHPPISPHPPTTSVGENASADQHLREAQTALGRHRTEQAQEALERAETRVLNNAPEGNASQNSTIIAIERAREALGHVRYLRPDPAQAGQLIDQALSQTGSSTSSGSQ